MSWLAQGLAILRGFGRGKKAVNFDQIELSGYSRGEVVVEPSPVNWAVPEKRCRAAHNMRDERCPTTKEENL